jgi:hypothetical protein
VVGGAREQRERGGGTYFHHIQRIHDDCRDHRGTRCGSTAVPQRDFERLGLGRSHGSAVGEFELPRVRNRAVQEGQAEFGV